MAEAASTDVPPELTKKFIDKGWTPENVVRIVIERARGRHANSPPDDTVKAGLVPALARRPAEGGAFN